MAPSSVTPWPSAHRSTRAAIPPGIGDTYTWTEPFDFVDELNTTCQRDESISCTSSWDCWRGRVWGKCGFAGHRDWRLPNMKELVSILDLEVFEPAIDPVFDNACTGGCTVRDCSCTAGASGEADHWSSTTDPSDTPFAWVVEFDDGDVDNNSKSEEEFVRAVRGGP